METEKWPKAADSPLRILRYGYYRYKIVLRIANIRDVLRMKGRGEV